MVRKKHFKATIEWSSSVKILLASTLAATITYATAAPLTGAINKTDVQNLKETLKELGPLSHIFNFPLNIIEKLLLITQKSVKQSINRTLTTEQESQETLVLEVHLDILNIKSFISTTTSSEHR